MRKFSKLHKRPVPARGWEGWSSLDRAQPPVCTENSNPDVMVMKAAEYRV
jgi:hypothetical protein